MINYFEFAIISQAGVKKRLQHIILLNFTSDSVAWVSFISRLNSVTKCFTLIKGLLHCSVRDALLNYLPLYETSIWVYFNYIVIKICGSSMVTPITPTAFQAKNPGFQPQSFF